MMGSAPVLKWTTTNEALEEMPVLKQTTKGSAGFDLITVENHIMYDNVIHVIHTGIKVEIPYGYVGLVLPRSSLGKKGFVLANTCGVIDSDYRGEIMLMGMLRANSQYKDSEPVSQLELEAGDRIAQLILVPVLHCNAEFVSELSDTERGEGGFGSTGK